MPINGLASTYVYSREVNCEGEIFKLIVGLSKKKSIENTYGSWDSLVVTHPTTNQPACSLSMTEQTGSPVFYTLWPYVKYSVLKIGFMSRTKMGGV